MRLVHDDVGSGPTVVLIHGHPFDASMWWPQLASMGTEFRLLAPDLRGYGRSPATGGTVTMAELAQDVWALLDELDVEAAAVIGLSMGGLVAMEMAISDPQRVWALGLVATTAEPVTDAERRQRLSLADEVEVTGMGPVVDIMGPTLWGPHADAATMARVGQMMLANNPVGTAAALRGRTGRPDYRPGLRGLGIPSLVCTGTADPWSTAEVTHELVECLPHCRTSTLPDVGHLPNLEAPERFNVELSGFLRDAWQAWA